MPKVILDGVTKVFEPAGSPAIVALSQASLVVEDRECLVVVGPSGCGKTTLLRLIAGLETPTSGTISIDGTVVNDLAPAQRNVAMVFQAPALYPQMSVYENLAFGLTLRGCARAELDLRVREIAQQLGLSERLQSKPEMLSNGERHRVSIGRAIARRPSALLLDEPLVSLDPPLRDRMRQEISSLSTRLGTTMVYVTHDHLEALRMGDRVAVLRDGVVQQVADPLTVYKHPANLFVASFIGFPPMNLFKGKVLVSPGNELVFEAAPAEEGQLPLGKPFRLSLDQSMKPLLQKYLSSTLILGLRPEHISCDADASAMRHGAFRAKIGSIQVAGADTYVPAQCGGVTFVARVPSAASWKSGQEALFRFDAHQVCLFDPATQQAIV